MNGAIRKSRQCNVACYPRQTLALPGQAQANSREVSEEPLSAGRAAPAYGLNRENFAKRSRERSFT
jgi:hypothetical protein